MKVCKILSSLYRNHIFESSTPRKMFFKKPKNVEFSANFWNLESNNNRNLIIVSNELN